MRMARFGWSPACEGYAFVALPWRSAPAAGPVSLGRKLCGPTPIQMRIGAAMNTDELAATMVAVENRPMYDNNCRNADGEERRDPEPVAPGADTPHQHEAGDDVARQPGPLIRSRDPDPRDQSQDPVRHYRRGRPRTTLITHFRDISHCFVAFASFLS